MVFRQPRRSIPESLKFRQKEILGEIKANTMVDCVYNSLIAGEIEKVIPLANAADLVPKFCKPYQVDDLAKSLTQRYVFNINKPGYGKTLETIIWIRTNLIQDFKVLILCPKSVISTWEAQLDKYWPGWAKDGFWWITNYEQFYNEERLERAKSFHWDCIVLDESHTIKSFRSKITHICFQLQKVSDARHCLTGTPIKNRPEDLAAQLKWLDPASITSYTDFQFSFCNLVKDKWGTKPKGLTKDKQMVDNLQRLLAVYTVGGEEHDIGVDGQPEVIKVRLKMDEKVKALYRETVGEYDKETKARVIDTGSLLKQGVKVSNAIEAATRRQQIASNCQLFNGEFRNVKFDWIVDWLRGTDEKVVIFSKFAKTIEALHEFLRKNDIESSIVVGGQVSRLREAQLNLFKSSRQVLLGTFGALGTGVDGLQDTCKYVIFIDREWTRSDNEQAECRVYRTGQGGKVIIYILQAIGTIDIQIERVQWSKGNDATILLEPIEEDEE